MSVFSLSLCGNFLLVTCHWGAFLFVVATSPRIFLPCRGEIVPEPTCSSSSCFVVLFSLSPSRSGAHRSQWERQKTKEEEGKRVQAQEKLGSWSMKRGQQRGSVENKEKKLIDFVVFFFPLCLRKQVDRGVEVWVCLFMDRPRCIYTWERRGLYVPLQIVRPPRCVETPGI